jgi:hypothetical protein
MLFASLMAFDAPGSENRFSVWVFVIAIWIFPIALLISPRLSKKALHNGQVKSAYYWVAIPLGLAAAPLVFSVAYMILGLLFIR